MSDDDPYAILGVNAQASRHEIKRAYRALSMRFHPDKNPASARAPSEEAFKKIGWAYAMIGDDERRKEWDAGLANGNARGNARANANESASREREFRDPFEMFASVFADDFARFDSMRSNFGFGRSMFGSAFDARENAFAAEDATPSRGSFAMGGGMGSGMFSGGRGFRQSAFSMSNDVSAGTRGHEGFTSTFNFTSTSTSTHVGRDGSVVTRTVTRRTLPDGSIEETENISTNERRGEYDGRYGVDDAIGHRPGRYYS